MSTGTPRWHTSLRMLDRKALRDLWHLRGPTLAIALVVCCGIACFVSMRSMVPHLSAAQQRYYRSAHFADLWAPVTRAPHALRAQIAAIPGVTAVETRVADDIVLKVRGLTEPATGHLMGLRPDGVAAVNRIAIRRGRPPAAARDNEVVLSEGFAEANHLSPGDSLGAVISGRWRTLHVVGIALTPEFVLEMRPTDLFPDSRRYGIVWMDDAAASTALGLQGAWNDAALTLAPGTSERAVITQLDALLAPYGARGAYGRELQASHRFLSDEIRQAATFATVAPAIFLGVAAFLLNIVLARLVASQREQIGMLKAFGVSTWALLRHYLLIALGPVTLGAVSGTALGLWLAGRLAALYARYYRMPDAAVAWNGSVIGSAVGISVAAAIVGAVWSVRRVQRLPAAEAMRPEGPAQYRAGLAERWRLDRWLSLIARMTVRGIERQPIRAGLALLGMALSVAIMMVGVFEFDAIDRLRDVHFTHAQREDIAVTFDRPRGADALRELRALPGVTRVEATRMLPVRFRVAQRTRTGAVVAIDPTDRLRRAVDRDGEAAALPADGLLLSRALATLLQVRAGDTVEVEALTGRRHRSLFPVAALLDDLVGTAAYLSIPAWQRVAGESEAFDGAVMAVERDARDRVYTRLIQMPRVAGVGARGAVLANFDQVMADSFNVTLLTLLLFASALSVGVVYNTARITLSERGRELASLRVLGFTQGEVARMLFGEQGVLGSIAIPVGFAIGVLFCWALSAGLSSELFRLPLVLRPRTFVLSAVLLVLSGAGSAVIIRRRLDRLDLVAVLKTRE